MNEEEKLHEELTMWVEDFVQNREWYKQFLKTFPLSEHFSFLAVYPSIIMVINQYESIYEINKLEKSEEFINQLIWDWLHLYYSDMNELNIYSNEMIHNDLVHLIRNAEWFEKNKEANEMLDKKYNAN